VQMQRAGCRPGPEVWRGRGRRRAARGEWALALREFAGAATPVASLTARDLLAQACLLRLAGDHEGANRFTLDVRALPERVPIIGNDGSPKQDRDVQARLWVRMLDDPPVDPADLVRRAERYVTNSQGEGKYVLGAALLRAGQLEDAILRFEESLAIEREWPSSGMNLWIGTGPQPPGPLRLDSPLAGAGYLLAESSRQVLCGGSAGYRFRATRGPSPLRVLGLRPGAHA
jgi:hypothetical protein